MLFVLPVLASIMDVSWTETSRNARTHSLFLNAYARGRLFAVRKGALMITRPHAHASSMRAHTLPTTCVEAGRV